MTVEPGSRIGQPRRDGHRRCRGVGSIAVAEIRVALDAGSGERAELLGDRLELSGVVPQLAVAEVAPSPGAPPGRPLGRRRPRRAVPRSRPTTGGAGRGRIGSRGRSSRGATPTSPRPAAAPRRSGRSRADRREPAHAPRTSRGARSTPSGALTANRKPLGTCAAHERNCSSDGSRYFVAFSSTVERRPA